MLRSQVARLLAKATVVDNRTVDEFTVEAWHEILHDVDYDDAMTALTDHRRNKPGVWLEPGHIIEGVRVLRRARLAVGTNIEGIPDADPDDVPAYLEAVRRNRLRVAGGENLRPVASLVDSTVRRLPRVEAADA